MGLSENLLLVIAGTLILGIGTNWIAWRIKVPAILLLLLVGRIAGPATGFLDPEKVFGDLLLPIVSLSVGLILFEGGLNLRIKDLRQTWRTVLGLLTIGVLATWAGGTIAAMYFLQLNFPTALVLGAVVVVTGPTVIGPLLREIRPTGRVGAVAKWEGITIDPVGATLALLVFEATDAIRSGEYASATMSAIYGLLSTAVSGTLVGVAAALILAEFLKRYWIPDYLQSPMTLMFVVGAFAAADWLHHESGLLAVTVMGVILANQSRVNMRNIVEFKESLSIVLISTLFILLSARIPLNTLTSLGWNGIAFAGALILIVRPVSVWLATLRSRLTRRERCFLAWLAPRGIVAAAVSSVFSLRLGEEGTPIASATFIVIVITVLVYGLTSGWLARQLGLSTLDPQGFLIAGANQVSRAVGASLRQAGFGVVLVDTRYPEIAKAREIGLSACFANVLSDHVLDEVDFGGLGRFLGMTSNDEVNTIAVARFRELFGRKNVYQLARIDASHSRWDTRWEKQLSGRTLFGADLTYDFFNRSLLQGATIKMTRLSESFDYQAFQARNGDRARLLFIVEDKRSTVATEDAKISPKPGQAIICLILPGEPTPAQPAPSTQSNERAAGEPRSA
jgi:NhaP-type Na+/H+ or K+/H+ antiporter